MTNNARAVFYFIILLTIGVIIYQAGEVLTPFIMAAVFAYILKPLVSLLAAKTKLSILASTIVVYTGILLLIFTSGIYLGNQLLIQIRSFAHDARMMILNIESGHPAENIPPWITPYLFEGFNSLKNSINISSQQMIKVLSGTISSISSLFIFLIALFYLLKDGGAFVEALHTNLPNKIKSGALAILTDVQEVLNNYLRAQFFLVLLMAIVGTLLFSLLDLRYALIIGIIIGLAEIIPIIGPFIAFIFVMVISAIGGGIGIVYLDPFWEIFMSGIIYLLLNQLENILIVPQITGRMVSLHPLIIMISVLVGGQLFGAIGFLLAVPVVASGKIVFNHLNRHIK